MRRLKEMNLNDPDKEDTTIYKVVVNHEEQYSIWPEYKENPLGWNDAGKSGPKAECLAYIKEVWTDMRPLNLRKKMEEMANNPAPAPPSPANDGPPEKSLVDRLCEGDYQVEVVLRPEKNARLFKEAIDRDYVHIKFTDTRGGTELGMRLDRAACDFADADFEGGKNTVHLEGGLTLDYVPIRCIADLNLETLQGIGRVAKVEAQA
jgi:uncharacterized protein YbdZ (MbtH family)